MAISDYRVAHLDADAFATALLSKMGESRRAANPAAYSCSIPLRSP
jgi:hypothetical protein